MLKHRESLIGYDLFTWSNNKRAPSPNCIIGISIEKETLEELSNLIWKYYLEIINDELDYFIELEYPYPFIKTEILDNPNLLNDYFSKSDLWSDFILEKLSILQKWDFKNSIYHLLKFKEVYRKDNLLYLLFYAIQE